MELDVEQVVTNAAPLHGKQTLSGCAWHAEFDHLIEIVGNANNLSHAN